MGYFLVEINLVAQLRALVWVLLQVLQKAKLIDEQHVDFELE